MFVHYWPLYEALWSIFDILLLNYIVYLNDRTEEMFASLGSVDESVEFDSRLYLLLLESVKRLN